MRVKNWLRANWTNVIKAIGAVGASAVALIISFAALNVSEQANRIADQQTELLRHQQLPVFQLKTVRVPDPNNPGSTREQLTIENLGGPVSEFDATPVAFIEAWNHWNSEGEIIGSPTLLPLQGYFGPDYSLYQGVTGNMQGQMAAWFGPTGNEHETSADQLINRFLTAIPGKMQMAAGLVWYVDIHYTDTFGANRREIYRVGFNGGGRVPDTAGYALMDRLEANGGANVQWLSPVSSSGEQAFTLWKENQLSLSTPTSSSSPSQ